MRNLKKRVKKPNTENDEEIAKKLAEEMNPGMIKVEIKHGVFVMMTPEDCEKFDGDIMKRETKA